MLKLGVITDEVSQDFLTAAKFAKQYGLHALEIRSADGKGAFELEWQDVYTMQKIADSYGLQIAAFSSPLFKCDISDTKTIAAHIESFRKLTDFAARIHCPYIRGFDFWEAGASCEQRAALYQPIADICAQFGVQCVVEYDPSVHASTAKKLAALLSTLQSPWIRALYDPGNGLWADSADIPFPNDYEVLKPYIAHVHIKDAVLQNGKAQAVHVGTGAVDYPGLFSRLKADEYQGFCMLETHYRKKSQLTEAQLKLPGGTKFSDGAYEASEESIQSLLALIK